MTLSARSTDNTPATVLAQGLKPGSSTGAGRIQIRGSQHPVKKKFIIRTITNKYEAAEYISELEPDEDHPVIVEVSPWEQKRSKLQNRYLWGWLYRYIADKLEEGGIVIPLDDGREYPYNAEILHEIFKDRFLCYDTISVNGKERKLSYSTTQLLMKPKEGEEQRGFANYIQQIKQFAIQVWEIYVPPTYSEDFRALESDLISGRYK